jgi:hypothetical protein
MARLPASESALSAKHLTRPASAETDALQIIVSQDKAALRVDAHQNDKALSLHDI